MSEMTEGLSPEAQPDTTVDAKTVFGIETKMQVPAFSQPNPYVPDRQEILVFAASSLGRQADGTGPEGRGDQQGKQGRGEKAQGHQHHGLDGKHVGPCLCQARFVNGSRRNQAIVTRSDSPSAFDLTPGEPGGNWRRRRGATGTS